MKRSHAKTFKLWSKRGFALPEVLIAAGLLATVAAGTASLMKILKKQQVETTTKYSAAQVYHNIVALLNNETAFQQTVASNAGLSCFAHAAGEAPTGNCPATNNLDPATCRYSGLSQSMVCNAGSITLPRISIVDDSAGTAFYSYLPTDGYTIGGQLCHNFVPNMNAGTGNDTCPLHYDIFWWAVCPAGQASCVAPALHVIVYPSFNSGKERNMSFAAWDPTTGNSLYGTRDFIVGTDPSTCNFYKTTDKNVVETCGSLGIRTTNPSASVQVVNADGTGNFPVARFSNPGGATANGSFQIDKQAAKGGRFVLNGNFVGINSAGPAAMLDIAGIGPAPNKVNAQINFGPPNLIGGQIGADGNSFTRAQGVMGVGLMFGAAPGIEGMRVNDQGLVGIGTNLPDAQMDIATVAGPASNLGGFMRIQGNQSPTLGVEGSYLNYRPVTQETDFMNVGSSGFAFNLNAAGVGNTHMQMDGSGNVAIGAGLSPTSTLSVLTNSPSAFGNGIATTSLYSTTNIGIAGNNANSTINSQTGATFNELTTVMSQPLTVQGPSNLAGGVSINSSFTYQNGGTAVFGEPVSVLNDVNANGGVIITGSGLHFSNGSSLGTGIPYSCLSGQILIVDGINGIGCSNVTQNNVVYQGAGLNPAPVYNVYTNGVGPSYAGGGTYYGGGGYTGGYVGGYTGCSVGNCFDGGK